MHQRKSKKILIYFFLLLLVGSINNISLNNLQFEKIKHIKVDGLDDSDNLILLKEIRNLNLGNIFSIKKDRILSKINSNSLVEEFNIFKVYPSSLNIVIDKTKFLAKININGKKFLVGSNGKLIKDDNLNNQLVFIFGKPDVDEFLNFKKIVDQSKFSYNEIKNLYFFFSKRWDIELKNGVIIKLSKNNILESLQLTYEFLNNNQFGDIKIIDARVKNQIILND
jgi:cell division protein FtsQ